MYEYQSIAFRDGKEIHRRTEILDGEKLSWHGVEVSRKGFLELINRFNRNGLIGIANGGPIYLYVASANLAQ